MHHRSQSTDSSLKLRRNPLNIHAEDGSDFVVPHEDLSPLPKNLKNKVVEVAKPTNVIDSVAELGIAQPQPQAESEADSEPLQLQLESQSFGGTLAQEMASFSLSRNNTITLRGDKATAKTNKVKSGPSRNPELIKRLRTIRERLSREDKLRIPDNDDVDEFERRPSAVGLPDNVLQMIAFSPDSPWLASEIESFDNTPMSAASDEFSSQSTTPDLHEIDGPESADVSHGSKVVFDEVPDELAPGQATAVTARRTVPEVEQSDAHSAIGEVVDEAPEVEPPVPAAPARPKPAKLSDTDPVDETDRGRLFLQINRLTNLNGLPIDVTRNPRFSLTLDNGLQTVTTAEVPFPAPSFNGALTARIGQEFELMVAKDLELVLTINVAMDALQPPERPVFREIVAVTPSPPPSPKKGGMRSFLSPKKSKQPMVPRLSDGQIQAQETQARLKREYEESLLRFRKRQSAWKGLTGKGGEYCRGYLFESHYEREITGKAKAYSLPLYNEWSLDAKGTPRHLCDLEVTMMYVPKLYGSEVLPASLRESQQALEVARARREQTCQGYLTQLGGDCSMWRRRFFVLHRNELLGYHEATRKLRISVDMNDTAEISEATSDDFWCIYEDRSFQIKFIDGETLSFYADTVEERDRWIRSLKMSVANCTGNQQQWTDLVLDRTD